tara:strand:- start:16 stop:591 length:576 start_codon:yes stop_codon:yes gene_type:complete
MSKILYCIRHGTALHNVLFWEIGPSVYRKYRDTPLVAKGRKEATKLGNTWNNIDNIELVIVSPLLRTLQTATNIFSNKNVPMIALDCLMEFPQGLDMCNYRKTIREYKPCYPKVDFSLITDTESKNWRHDREETIEELNNRIEEMKEFIKSRPEKHIAIVSHSSYLGQFLNGEIGDEHNELKHCFPYIHKL